MSGLRRHLSCGRQSDGYYKNLRFRMAGNGMPIRYDYLFSGQNEERP